MNPKLIRQFHFTRSERHGAVALLLLTGIVFLWPDIYRAVAKPGHTDYSAFSEKIEPYRLALQENRAEQATAGEMFPFDPNTATVEEFVRLGITEKVARTIVKYRSRGGAFRTAADLQKIYTLPEEDFERLQPFVRIPAGNHKPSQTAHRQRATPAAAFPFDPNTASATDLLRLGLPESLVTRLLRYREKGGRFRKKEDFRKLYGLKEEDYVRLEPFMALGPETLSATAPEPAGLAYRRPLPSPIDINTASAEEWQTLPGICAARAQKILRFRDKLGGFARADQVSETYGLPDSVFQAIRSYLHCTTPPFRKINLNSASLEELAAHPYLDFKQARLIAAYREQHGAFTSPAELGKIAAFRDSDWLNRIIPYLETTALLQEVK